MTDIQALTHRCAVRGLIALLEDDGVMTPATAERLLILHRKMMIHHPLDDDITEENVIEYLESIYV